MIAVISPDDGKLMPITTAKISLASDVVARAEEILVALTAVMKSLDGAHMQHIALIRGRNWRGALLRAVTAAQAGWEQQVTRSARNRSKGFALNGKRSTPQMANCHFCLGAKSGDQRLLQSHSSDIRLQTLSTTYVR